MKRKVQSSNVLCDSAYFFVYMEQTHSGLRIYLEKFSFK